MRTRLQALEEERQIREIGVAVRKGYFRGSETWVGVQIFGMQSPPVQEGLSHH